MSTYQYRTTYNEDGSVTIWDCRRQEWVRTSTPSDGLLATLDQEERGRVMAHIRDAPSGASEPNTWWVDDIESERLDRRYEKPSDLLNLNGRHPGWLALGDEDEFGGHVIYAHPKIANFLQRALRLREGRDPLTGEPLPVSLETVLSSPLLASAFYQKLLTDLLTPPTES